MNCEEKTILLTFDVEDWFQVENFKRYIRFSTWNSFDLRVERSTLKVLDLLDQFPFKPKATFFILGWIAEKLPRLIREIAMRGHEIASHGYNHHLCTSLEYRSLLQDLINSRKFLESITGIKINGFRAPSFAVNDTILKTIHEAGYTYDSSFNSFSGHGRYGSIDLAAATRTGNCFRFSDHFYEIPVSNANVNGTTFPLGGGGYFRLYPFGVFRKGVESVLNKHKAFVFYAHPWEFDPDQPRMRHASTGSKFRHYVNLHKTEEKLKKLIESFSNLRFLTCSEYIAG